MDPIGFALENFDADGAWRTADGGGDGRPIDTSGVLWDGTSIDGPVDLREALLGYAPQFARSFAEKLLTYALGRGVEYFDMPTVRTVVAAAERNEHRFSSYVLGIVTSPAFQMRIKQAAPASARQASVPPDERTPRDARVADAAPAYGDRQ
jgi:hypothetical protein